MFHYRSCFYRILIEFCLNFTWFWLILCYTAMNKWFHKLDVMFHHKIKFCIIFLHNPAYADIYKISLFLQIMLHKAWKFVFSPINTKLAKLWGIFFYHGIPNENVLGCENVLKTLSSTKFLFSYTNLLIIITYKLRHRRNDLTSVSVKIF